MWGNFRIKKKLENLYYTKYKVKGSNLDLFIKILKKKGINLYSVKKSNNKSMTFMIKAVENEKFFANLKEIWYNDKKNVKKVSDTGKFYLLFKWLIRFGIVVGAVVFLVGCFLIDNVIFDIEYTGNGNIYSNQVTNYLKENGIQKYSYFSDIDLKKLEDKILKDNDCFSFVSCIKYGNRLKINIILSSEKVKTIDNGVKELKSSEDGKIEKIKVYRGTANVKVGDYVSKGDTLVCGYMDVKEQRVEVNVLAFITLSVNKKFTFIQNIEDDDLAVLFAENQLDGQTITDKKVDKINYNKEFIYTVTLTYNSVIVAGN